MARDASDALIAPLSMDSPQHSLRSLRRFTYAALGVAFTHLVFGAIVRISGSGMGCGDHWPRCYGHWFPPMNRLDLQIEWTHRLLASILVITVASLFVFAFRSRATPGVGGRGGVLRATALAFGAVITAALLGALTVKLGNPPFATVAHWIVAMTLFATLGAAAIRAGGLGGARVRSEAVSAKVVRGSTVAAAIAGITVAMGGLTAKFPSAAIACRSFPLCGPDPSAAASAVHVQLTHRALAILLVLHLLGMVVAIARRGGESRTVTAAARIALGLVLLQIVVAVSMVLMTLPPVLRSLHEAVGVSVWLSVFAFAYLARSARRPATAPDAGEASPSAVPVPGTRVPSPAR